MSEVKIETVTKRFGRVLAVDSLSLHIPEGTLFGLLGPNGAGKTTMIRMIMSIFYPDSGRILIDGHKLSEAGKQRIGYLPEERGLYKKMKVGRHLEYLARLKGLTAAEARRRAAEFLERLGLGEWSRKKVEELSKGMAQKVQFAAALIHDPSLVILDEPFSGLDPLNVQLLIDWMAELHERGVTIVFSTHQMETVEKLCESIGLINRGRLLVGDELKALKARFGRSKIRLEIAGDGSFEPGGAGVLSAERHGAGWEIQLAEGEDGQRLLAEAMSHGRVDRFERVEPSLQEIFVRLVEADRTEN